MSAFAPLLMEIADVLRNREGDIVRVDVPAARQSVHTP
jgi:hypothetical protein